MSEYNKNHKIESSSLSDELFYEMEYHSDSVQEVGDFKVESQKIIKPEKDEIREHFIRMRDIGRTHRTTTYNHRFFDRRIQNGNALVFYKQGVFMKDFTDDFKGNTPFSQYFPYYQMMGYEQLRTYFTWRTKVIKGNIKEISVSYAFLYIYELLNNIGVDSPQEGMENLLLFWKAFREYNKTIDKYIARWLKDYHIYYGISQSFKEFAEKNDLTEYYPKMTDNDTSFELFCAISKYDIQKSVFFTDESIKMITNCFSFVIERIQQEFKTAGIHFSDALFHPTKKLITWKTFKETIYRGLS